MVKIQFNQSSVLAGAHQTYALSSLLNIEANADAPATIALRVYDRDAYSGVQSYDYGYFSSPNGGNVSAGTQYKPTTLYFDLVDGKYVSRTTGEALSAFTFTTSDQNYRSVYLSIFTNTEVQANYEGNWFDLKWQHISDLNVVTRTDYVDLTPNFATPAEIAALAKSFIGKVWNNEGCWLLTSNISAAAGASLPVASAKTGAVDLVGNTQWQVVFNGAQQSGDWRALLQLGDIVEMGFLGGTAHIATVTSGEGHTALWVDNSGESAHTASPADIIIQGEHSVEDATYKAIDKTVVIYRLSSSTQGASTLLTPIAPPVVTAYSQSIHVGDSLPLRSLFSVKDPNLLSMVAYQIIDGSGTSHIALNGAVNLASAIQLQAGMVIVSASDLTKLTYTATLGAGALTVTAFNGQAWGSVNLSVTGWIDPPATVTGESISLHAQSQLLPAASLFTAVATAGHTITEYRFKDKDHSGQLVLTQQKANLATNEEAALGIYRVSAADLSTVNWKTLGATGTFSVSVFDGVQWSDYAEVTIAGLNNAPTVTASARKTISVGVAIPVSSLFNFSDIDNDEVKFVSIYDYWQNIQLNGAHDYCPDPHTFQVKVSELGLLTYTAPNLMGGVQGVSVYASDGTTWSRPVGVLFSITDPRPIVEPISSQQLGLNQIVPLNSLIFSLDPNGKAITQYQVSDPSGGGTLQLNAAKNLATAAETAQGIITIAAADLNKLTYKTAGAVGSEVLLVSAYNGEIWGSTQIAIYSSDGSSPIVRAEPVSIDVGSTANLSDLVRAYAPSGKPILKYMIRDPAGSGSLLLNGAQDIATAQEKSQGGSVFSASDFGSLRYVASSTGSIETVSILAFDGSSWGAAELSITSKNFNRPVVTTKPITVHAGESISVQDLFTVFSPNAKILQNYQINDTGHHLVLNGAENIWAAQQYQGIYGIQARDIVKIVYVAGQPGTDTIYIEASDTQGSSIMQPVTITVLPNPVVTATTVTLAVQQTLALTDLFNVTNPSGKAITQYKIIDPSSAGSVYLNGAVNLASLAEQSQGVAIIAAADISKLSYKGASAFASESLSIAAYDGESWGKAIIPAITIDGGAPQIVAPAATVELDSSSTIDSLMTVTSHSGQVITQYRILDPLGGGRIALNGATNLATAAQQAQEGMTLVNAAEFAKLLYVGADATGTETLTVSAYDGQSWGSESLRLQSVKTPAPVIAPVKTYLDAGQSVSLLTLFEVQKFGPKDISYYLLQDTSNHIQLNGATNLWAEQQSAGYYWIRGSEMSKLTYASTQDGVFHFNIILNDGFNYSSWAKASAIVGKNNLNLPPSVTPLDTTVALEQAVLLSSLFATSDPFDNAITMLRIIDPIGAGSVLLNGATDLASSTERASGMMVFSAADMSKLRYQGASSVTTEALTISIYDGIAWGSADIAITSAKLPPQIKTLTTAVEINDKLDLSKIFNAITNSGNAITQYKIQDPQGAGNLLLNGATNLADSTQKAQGISIFAASDLDKVQYQGASSTGKETLLIAASDGHTWGVSNVAMSFTDHRAPTLAQLATTTDIASTTWLSSYFVGTSVSGKAIVQYQIQDPSGGGKVLINSAQDMANAAQKSQGIIVVSPFDLRALLYVGADNSGSETLTVTAYDGQSSTTLNVPIKSVSAIPPVVSVKPLIMHQGDSMYLSQMFSVSNTNGYAIKTYVLTDPDISIKLNGAANGFSSDLFDYQGHYYLYAADWNKVQYQVQSLGTVKIGIQVDDGHNISSYVEQVITKVANEANAKIVGTAAEDYLLYAGARGDFSIHKTSDGFSVLDKRALGHNETITQIEHLVFSDLSVNLMIKANAASIPTSTLDSLIELYIAYLGRVPDADGLNYWIGQAKQGMSLDQMGEVFYSAALQYPLQTGYTEGMSNADFVKIIYKNVLGRTGITAPPDADVAYWAGQLSSGAASKGTLIKTMLTSAHSFKGDATWGWVADLLDNKITVSKIFAIDDGLSYNLAADSVSHGIAIAAAVTATDISAALQLIGTSGDLGVFV